MVQQRVVPFRDNPHPGEQAVVGAVANVEVAALDRGAHPDASTLVALVCQGWQPSGRGRVESPETVLPGGDGVMGGIGPQREGPDWEPGGISDQLNVAAEPLVLVRIPGVFAGLGALSQSVGRN